MQSIFFSTNIHNIRNNAINESNKWKKLIIVDNSYFHPDDIGVIVKIVEPPINGWTACNIYEHGDISEYEPFGIYDAYLGEDFEFFGSTEM